MISSRKKGQSHDDLHFAMPTVEIDRTMVVVKTKSYRKTRAVPTEYPDAPQDPSLYTGERSMYAKTKEGGDMAEFDNWIEKGSVIEPHPWIGTTVFYLKEPLERDGNAASSSDAMGGRSDGLSVAAPPAKNRY